MKKKRSLLCDLRVTASFLLYLLFTLWKYDLKSHQTGVGLEGDFKTLTHTHMQVPIKHLILAAFFHPKHHVIKLSDKP